MSRMVKDKFNINKHLAEVLHMPPLAAQATRLDVWTISSMDAATRYIPRQLLYWPERGTMKANTLTIPARACNGDAERLARATEDSNDLLADAIIADPRLARKSQWVRAEEGEVVCPALLSQGDDAPCFTRARALESQPNGCEPIKVVISTDSSEVPARTAAAFIATVRLVQQWRPVEIWWQGSWLGTDRRTGWIFHVPLISGDMDFSRLEFCIADRCRDSLSWSIMMARACEETHATWNDCSLQAERSYMPGAQFVSHHGIDPDGESIACNAARWLGWETFYSERWDYERSVEGALQKLPPPFVKIPDPTPEDRARYKADGERWEKERKERESKAAAARESALSHNY